MDAWEQQHGLDAGNAQDRNGDHNTPYTQRPSRAPERQPLRWQLFLLPTLPWPSPDRKPSLGALVAARI